MIYTCSRTKKNNIKRNRRRYKHFQRIDPFLTQPISEALITMPTVLPANVKMHVFLCLCTHPSDVHASVRTQTLFLTLIGSFECLFCASKYSIENVCSLQETNLGPPMQFPLSCISWMQNLIEARRWSWRGKEREMSRKDTDEIHWQKNESESEKKKYAQDCFITKERFVK